MMWVRRLGLLMMCYVGHFDGLGDFRVGACMLSTTTKAQAGIAT